MTYQNDTHITMKTITVDVVSVENVKPPHDRHYQPFKLCLLDQIAPLSYTPFIFFYPAPVNYQNAPSFSARLKSSLSLALSRAHPLSGRLTDDNNLVHDFHQGVPYRDAVVNCTMSEFMENRSKTILSCLNQFLPRRPAANEKSKSTSGSTLDLPQLAVQLTAFSCGGVAVGVAACHKITDGTTMVAFFNMWAAITRGESPSDHDHDLDLDGGSLRFPPVASVEAPAWESTLSCDVEPKTERFVFDEEALATIKSQSRSDVVSNPTRVEALSGFIWKSAISAFRTVSSSSSSTTHFLGHAVNIRPRGPTTGTEFGNIYLGTGATYEDDYAQNLEKPNLPKLVGLVSESISKFKNDVVRSLRGSEAVDLVNELSKATNGVFLSENFHVVGISSWVNMGFKDVDFGLGNPIWIGLWGNGDGGPEYSNIITINEATWSKDIEVWINFDKKVLEVMKNDPEFRAFAAVDPPIPFNNKINME